MKYPIRKDSTKYNVEAIMIPQAMTNQGIPMGRVIRSMNKLETAGLTGHDIYLIGTSLS
jgi:hypothetical protein